MAKIICAWVLVFLQSNLFAQLQWHLVDSMNNSLPKGLRLFYTNDSIEGKPNIAYYLEANLNNKDLSFDVDTTYKRRLTPTQFYEKNNKPYVVVNGTFFSFQTNQNLNVAIHDGRLVSYNIKSVTRKRKDSSVYEVPVNRSAIGITKKRKADIAWIKTDTGSKYAYAKQTVQKEYNKLVGADVNTEWLDKENKKALAQFKKDTTFKKWKMQTAIGGGPVLLQNGEIAISNEEELMFTGKGINDRHPRTAMGYTSDNRLIIIVIQGRFPNKADGATLIQEATILKNLGCIEALNLDGGGSSCMLVNGKETITPCDKTGQRPVPAVFLIK